MKIVIFNTFYHPIQVGGAEKSVQILAESLFEMGHTPVIITTSDTDRTEVVNGVRVYYVKLKNLYWNYNPGTKSVALKPFWHAIDSHNLFMVSKIKHIINEEQPEVIHTNNLSGFSDVVWAIANKRGIKVVHTLRDYYQLCPKSTMFKNTTSCKTQCSLCKVYSSPKKSLSKYVNEVVGISQFILEMHIKNGFFPKANKNVIYNSVEPPKTTTKQNHRTEKVILGYVGSIAQHKGIEFLLENMAKLNNEIELYVFGKAQNDSYIKHLSNAYPSKNYIFKGFSTPEEIYKSIDILVVPSLWGEPFGRIVAEATSYQIPVLASNRGGLPELVVNNGEVFNPDSNQDFVDKLRVIVHKHLEGVYTYDYSKFDQKFIATQYLKLYSNQSKHSNNQQQK